MSCPTTCFAHSQPELNLWSKPELKLWSLSHRSPSFVTFLVWIYSSASPTSKQVLSVTHTYSSTVSVFRNCSKTTRSSSSSMSVFSLVHLRAKSCRHTTRSLNDQSLFFADVLTICISINVVSLKDGLLHSIAVSSVLCRHSCVSLLCLVDQIRGEAKSPLIFLHIVSYHQSLKHRKICLDILTLPLPSVIGPYFFFLGALFLSVRADVSSSSLVRLLVGVARLPL